MFDRKKRAFSTSTGAVSAFVSLELFYQPKLRFESKRTSWSFLNGMKRRRAHQPRTKTMHWYDFLPYVEEQGLFVPGACWGSRLLKRVCRTAVYSITNLFWKEELKPVHSRIAETFPSSNKTWTSKEACFCSGCNSDGWKEISYSRLYTRTGHVDQLVTSQSN